MNTSAVSLEVDVADRTEVITAFKTLRQRLVANTLRSVLNGSRLRFAMIVGCSLVFWLILFGLFFGGFHFLANYLTLTNVIVEYIFGMFFFSLLIMLFFSTGIIIYASMFHSKEAAYLLTTPASADRIFAYKFAEALGFSSWAFLLLGSPLMVAYGISVGTPIWFYGLFLIYLFAFILIPGAIGSITAMFVATFLPRRQKTVLASLGALIILSAIYLGAQVWGTSAELFSQDWLDSMLARLSFSQNAFLPSRWMSTGLVAGAKGDFAETTYYFLLLSGHGGLAYLFAAFTAKKLYRLGYSRVQAGKSSRRRVAWYVLDDTFHKLFFFLAKPIRILILKDLRTFCRDPAQWSQFLIFFGLLAFYFLNIRRLSYDGQTPYWRNLVSFLNVGVTALILSTFTSRFIFPLLSLEGRNFWVLGLLPLKRAQILWGKFAFASGISLVATETLILISDIMLRMEPEMIGLHVAMVAVLCFGLSGISVGLGARLPNLKEEDPSKIATGFGGTLNLLVSLVFIFSIVTSLAIPCHLYFAGQDTLGNLAFGSGILNASQFRFWMTVAALGSLTVGVVATVVPLRIGIRAFNEMEF